MIFTPHRPDRAQRGRARQRWMRRYALALSGLVAIALAAAAAWAVVRLVLR